MALISLLVITDELILQISFYYKLFSIDFKNRCSKKNRFSKKELSIYIYREKKKINEFLCYRPDHSWLLFGPLGKYLFTQMIIFMRISSTSGLSFELFYSSINLVLHPPIVSIHLSSYLSIVGDHAYKQNKTKALKDQMISSQPDIKVSSVFSTSFYQN